MNKMCIKCESAEAVRVFAGVLKIQWRSEVEAMKVPVEAVRVLIKAVRVLV